jgi:hypothetical protein
MRDRVRWCYQTRFSSWLLIGRHDDPLVSTLHSMARYSDELFKTWLERPAEDKFHIVCSSYLPFAESSDV